MSYVVLARKYRPQLFSEIVAQKAITKSLQNSIVSNRVGHAYLFTGTRGVGKTTTARIFAKALNCLNGPSQEPCNNCQICRNITDGVCLDVIEIDGASNNSVNDIREIVERVKYKPISCRYKIYIIDEVHMLSESAFNALLKTLEEPPPHTKFIFATTDPHKIPPTVLSRCQRFDFKKAPYRVILDHLKDIANREQIEYEEGALEIIARAADGSIRDSLSLLDQMHAYSEGIIRSEDVRDALGFIATDSMLELLDRALSRDSSGVEDILKGFFSTGTDPRVLSSELFEHIRNLVVASTTKKEKENLSHLLDISDHEAQLIKDIARKYNPVDILNAFEIIKQAILDMSYFRTINPIFLLESALLKICTIKDTKTIEELIELIQKAPSLKEANTESGSSVDKQQDVKKWLKYFFKIPSLDAYTWELIKHCVLLKEEDMFLFIGYPEHIVADDKYRSEEFKERLSSLLERISGIRVAIRFVRLDRQTKKGKENIATLYQRMLERQKEEVREKIESSERIRKVLEVLDAEIEDIFINGES